MLHDKPLINWQYGHVVYMVHQVLLCTGARQHDPSFHRDPRPVHIRQHQLPWHVRVHGHHDYVKKSGGTRIFYADIIDVNQFYTYLSIIRCQKFTSSRQCWSGPRTTSDSNPTPTKWRPRWTFVPAWRDSAGISNYTRYLPMTWLRKSH